MAINSRKPYRRISLKRKRDATLLVLVAVVVLLVALGNLWRRSRDRPPEIAPPPVVTPALTGTVIHALDGDSLTVQPTGEHRMVTIHLIGLEAPRKATRDREGQEPWGTRAQQFVTLLVTRKEVRVEFDVLVPTEGGKSSWGYVWFGDRLLNEEVLKAGHAVLATRPPNVRYVERLMQAQAEARENGRNIWNPSEPLPEPPDKFVASTPKPAGDGETLPAFVEGCVVGNAKSKKYHVPGGQYYNTAKTSEHAVFFRTAEDARKAGYTAAAR
jgi:micrococcal nuclease